MARRRSGAPSACESFRSAAHLSDCSMGWEGIVNAGEVSTRLTPPPRPISFGYRMKKSFLVWFLIASLVPLFFVLSKRNHPKPSPEQSIPVEPAESPRVVQITNYITREKETFVHKKESPAEILAALKAIK